MMNRIVNGKRYDTETAKPICVRTNYYNGNCVSSWDSLYRKKNGEFFLCRTMTGFNCFDLESEIHPIDENRAKSFAEENMDDADCYEAVFGKVEE